MAIYRFVLLLFCILSTIGYAADSISETKLFTDFQVAYLNQQEFIKKHPEVRTSYSPDKRPPSIEAEIKNIVAYCMDSKHPINKQSLLYKIIETNSDTDTHGEISDSIIHAIHNYIRQNKIEQEKKKDVVCFLLDDTVSANWQLVLYYFYDEKCYNAKAKELIKKTVMKSDFMAEYLFFIDAANLYDDKDIKEYLETESKKCKEWKPFNVNRKEWLSLILQAKHGDKKALDKVIQIASADLPLDAKRVTQIMKMPFQLSLIRDKRIMELLKEFLLSDEKFWFSELENGTLGQQAAVALNAMIIGFPDTSRFEPNLNQSQISQNKAILEECKKWMKENKDYKFRDINDYSIRVKMTLFCQ